MSRIEPFEQIRDVVDPPIDGYALKYPGKKVDFRTTFDTLEEVESFIKHCGDKRPATRVPLCFHPSYEVVIDYE